MTDPTADRAADLDELCAALGSLLDGDGRREIVDRVTRGDDLDEALRRLRASMSSHGFEGLSPTVPATVRRMDQRTRQDGFRVLHAWNHASHEFTDELVPVLMIDFFQRAAPAEPDPCTTVSILLDYYLLHLLALAAIRVWDSEQPSAALDRVTGLLDLLQGPDGSGHRFATDAETLLIYALSQFHPEEQAYDRLIEKAASLQDRNRIAFARVSAAVLGAHLRWGFWTMYERDIQRMRDDNVGDYPWLLWSVTTLLDAWVAMGGAPGEAPRRDTLAGSILLGLAADPWAFGGRAPAALEPFAEMYEDCRALLNAHGTTLLDALGAHKPSKSTYSPLSLLFNFPHNALVAAVTVALLEGWPRAVALDDLFRESETLWEGRGGDPASPEAKEELARALTAFSMARPERLGYRGALLVTYDPLTAIRTHSMTMKALREGLG